MNPNGADKFRRGEVFRAIAGKVSSLGLGYFRRGEPLLTVGRAAPASVTGAGPKSARATPKASDT